MIISLDKFKATGGSGGSGSGFDFSQIGYNKEQVSEANTILTDDLGISIIGFNSWDSSRNDASYLFAGSEIEFGPAIDMQNVTNIEGMYSNCKKLKYVPEIDLTNVENANFLFDGCSSLSGVVFTGDATGTLTDGMFNNTQMTVSFKDNGTFDSIISAAQQNGNIITRLFDKNIAMFQVFNSNMQYYNNGVRPIDNTYALINDQKYPLRYKGNGNYFVELDFETEDNIQIVYEDNTWGFVETGRDNGVIPQHVQIPEKYYRYDINHVGNFSTNYGVNHNGDGTIWLENESSFNISLQIPFKTNNFGGTTLRISFDTDYIDQISWSFIKGDTSTGEQYYTGPACDFSIWVSHEWINYWTENQGSVEINFSVLTSSGTNLNYFEVENIGVPTLPEDNLETTKCVFFHRYDKTNKKWDWYFNNNNLIEAKLNGDIFNTGDTYYDRAIECFISTDSFTDQYGNPVECLMNNCLIKSWEYSFNIEFYDKEDQINYKKITTVNDLYRGFVDIYIPNNSNFSYSASTFSNKILLKSDGVELGTYTFEGDKLTLPPQSWVLLKFNSNINGISFNRSYNNLRLIGPNKEVIYNSEFLYYSQERGIFWTNDFAILKNISDTETIVINGLNWYNQFEKNENLLTYNPLLINLCSETGGRQLNLDEFSGHTITFNGEALQLHPTAQYENVARYYIDIPDFIWMRLQEMEANLQIQIDDTLYLSHDGNIYVSGFSDSSGSETTTYDNLWLVDTDCNTVAQFTQTVEDNANEYTVNTAGLSGYFGIINFNTSEYYSIPVEYTNEIYGRGPTATVTDERKYHINFMALNINIDGSDGSDYFLHINIPEDYIGFMDNGTMSLSGDNYTE